MALNTGERLGSYEIIPALEAGGMGEVYRARDIRLGRTVAVKVLPKHVSEREEARAVASLEFGAWRGWDILNRSKRKFGEFRGCVETLEVRCQKKHESQCRK